MPFGKAMYRMAFVYVYKYSFEELKYITNYSFIITHS